MPGTDIKAIGRQAIDLGLWCLDSHFVTWGCKGSLRMTVIATPKGLILYSPVALSEAHVAQIQTLGAAIGGVWAIIAPNLFHHFYLRACMAHFPAARVFVPDGLAAKIGPIDGAEDMTCFDAGDEVTSCTVSGHRLNETVLFHHPTGTLVTADLLYNYQAEHFTAEKLFFRLIGCYGQPAVAPYHRLAIRDAAEVRRALTVIRQWPVRRIIMSHGRILDSASAGEVFAAVWGRIVSP